MTKSVFFDKFREVITKLGVSQGDVLYVASDMKLLPLMYLRSVEDAGQSTAVFMDDLIEAMTDCIGHDGTILFPVFSWDFCKGEDFVFETCKGRTGSLGNYIIRARQDFLRTQHPIYSFMVKGRYAEHLASLQNIGGWDMDSPFAFLHQKQAKMLMINVDAAQCNTFEHYVEETIQVPYRYQKDFMGNYSRNGEVRRRVYRMYVRDLAYPSVQLSGENLYFEQGVMKKDVFMDTELRLLDLAGSFQIVAADMICNGGINFYTFDNYVLDWRCGHTHESDLIIVH